MEYLGQVGFNGFEAGIEGPFKKGSNASFVANYRYSTLDVVQQLGLDIGTGSAIPEYQDLTFKINVPTEDYGQFSLWGIGGFSYIELLEDTNEEANLFSQGEDVYYSTGMGAIGMEHLYFFNENTYGKAILSLNSSYNNTRNDTLNPENPSEKGLRYGHHFVNSRLSFRYELNKKINARHRYNTGLIANHLFFEFRDSSFVYPNQGGPGYYLRLRDVQGSTQLIQPYIQWKYRINEKWSVMPGLHGLFLSLDNQLSLEPRLASQYVYSQRGSLNFGAGLHGQMMPTMYYFSETELPDGSFTQTNRDVDFSKSLQFVLGHDYRIGKNIRTKVEVYYQHLYNLPVREKPVDDSLSNAFRTIYSTVNEGADFNLSDVEYLVNTGRGRNYGLELTIEKPFSNGFYFLATTSLFRSRYEDLDEEWRPTAFDGGFVANGLAGKEFQLKEGKHTLAIDLKVTWAGGRRYIPVSEPLSNQANEVIPHYERAYYPQYPNYFRADVKFTYRSNGKILGRAITQEWFVDLQNVTNHQNVFSRNYDPIEQTYSTTYQIGFFPNFNYQVKF